jgi:hypothetical protein
VSDVIQEIEEEIRRERYRKLWDRYGVWVIAVAVLVIAGVAGWRGYDWWQNRLASDNGAAYSQAMAQLRDGKGAGAAPELARLKTEGTTTYRQLARFAAAAELASRDRTAAVAAYDAIAADAGLEPLVRDLAQVRAGLLLVDTASLDDIRRRMEPLTGAGGAYRNAAREAIGMVAWRTGDLAAARTWFDRVLADPEAPSGARQRIEVLNAITAGTGG